jgi:hypothetical protein
MKVVRGGHRRTVSLDRSSGVGRAVLIVPAVNVRSTSYTLIVTFVEGGR